MFPRRRRFKRDYDVPTIQLGPRDRQIISLVHQHRFIRSSDILKLVPGSPQHILRRLQLLYHNGFLERPRAQLDYYHKAGSAAIVYGLGQTGSRLLRTELGLSPESLRWGEKNRGVGRIFLEHALAVTETMIRFEVACLASGRVEFLSQSALQASNMRTGDKFAWSVNIDGGHRLGVVPDQVFALEYRDQAGELDRAYFFLEADRGTMPVIRTSLTQTSFYRKLLAYESTWAQSVHRKKFGFHRFRVLTLTQSADRLTSLVEACSRLRSGHGLFLFATHADFRQCEDVFSFKWQVGRQGEQSTLLN
jgi:hypothetical protein